MGKVEKFQEPKNETSSNPTAFNPLESFDLYA